MIFKTYKNVTITLIFSVILISSGIGVAFASDDSEEHNDSTTTATGHDSSAFGLSTTASGDNSVAFGGYTTASGENSAAFGDGTIASGFFSTAFGFSTTASGFQSTTFGLATTAQPYSSFVIGQFNEISGNSTSCIGADPLFVIGNGDSSSNRNNAVTVLKNGNVGIGVSAPTQPLQVAGIIESTSGEFKFPDGTTQSTAGSGDITAVTAGTGLTGGGTSGDVTLNVDTTSIQNRVTGTCTSGESIRVINSDGTVTCEVDNDTVIWTQSGSDIYYNTGNVGIGTSSPNETLDVTGNILVRDPSNNGAIIISPSTSSYGADPEFVIQSAETGAGNDSPFHISRNAEFTTSDNKYYYIDNSGDDASRILFGTNGDIKFSNAPSGTGSITWTDVLLIDASTDNVEITNGYLQLDTNSGTPPSGDCDASNEIGRMKVDRSNNNLYVCTNNGWQTK